MFREVLLDLRDLQSLELIRLQKIKPGGIAEVERLNGHAQSRRISEISLDECASSVAMSAKAVDGMDRVLARMSGLTLDLSPFLYVADDDTGHRTRVLDFKYKKAEEWHLQCVADSTTKTSPAALHEALLVRVDRLLENPGEGG